MNYKIKTNENLWVLYVFIIPQNESKISPFYLFLGLFNKSFLGAHQKWD